MHDIDRTQLEYDPEIDAFGSGSSEILEEGNHAGLSEEDSPFSEIEEMEFASELLGVSDEAELDQFLGRLIGSAGRALGRVARSPVGRALGGLLKNAARKALPLIGQAAGAYFGGPAGAAIGGRLASTAGQAFGLEVEGLSSEDAEFEVARRFVRLSGAAAANAASAPPTAPASAAARTAFAAAAQRHAPGLAQPLGGPSGMALGSGMSGRWYRRGRKIVLVGV